MWLSIGYTLKLLSLPPRVSTLKLLNAREICADDEGDATSVTYFFK
jgi:hypothetical protein